MDAVSILSAIPLFGGLPRERVTDLAHASRLYSVEPHHTILSEGDDGFTMYVILRGRVSVSRLNKLGDRVIFHELGSGEFFRELSMACPSFFGRGSQLLEMFALEHR